MATDRRFKRGPTANVTAALASGTLLDGDPIFDRTQDRLYIGKGATSNGPADHMIELATATSVDTTRGTILSRRFFGMHIGFGSSFNTPQTNWHTEFGYGALRLWDVRGRDGSNATVGITWRLMEPSKGAYDWRILDEYLTRAVGAGITAIMIVLGNPPAWATGGVVGGPNASNTSDYYKGINTSPPANMQDGADFAAALATHCRAVVGADVELSYEIWNEPNSTTFYTGTVAQLVAYSQAVSAAIRAVDARAIMVSPTPPGKFAPDYLDQLFAAGLGPHIDVIGFHLYVYPDPAEQMIDLALRFRQVAGKHGYGHLPAWNTEAGWNRFVDEGGVTRTAPARMSAAQAEDYLIRYYLAAIAAGLGRTYFYGLDQTWSALDLIDQTDRTTVKAGGQALQALTTLLVGARVVDYSFNAAAGLHALGVVLASGARQTWVWATDNRVAQINNDRNVQVVQRIEGLLAPVARDVTTGAVTVSSRPSRVIMANSLATPTAALVAGTAQAGAELLGNPTLSTAYGTGTKPVPLWIANMGAAAYAGTDATPGSSPLTLQPAARFQIHRQVIGRRMLRGYRYAATIRYKSDAAKTYSIRLQIGATGSLVAPDASFDMIATGGAWYTQTLEFDLPMSTQTVSPDLNLTLINYSAGPWAPIHVEYISLRRLGVIAPDALPIRRVWMDVYPSTGNWGRDDQVWFTNSASLGLAVVCTTAGTFGTLTGVTATNAANSDLITVNTPDVLSVGDVVTIAGGGAASYLIAEKLSGTSYRINARQTSALTGAAVQYVAPVFAPLGLGGAGLTVSGGELIADFGSIRSKQTGTAQFSVAGYTWEHTAPASAQRLMRAFLQNDTAGTGGSSSFRFRHDRDDATYRDWLNYNMSTEALSLNLNGFTLTSASVSIIGATRVTGALSVSGTAGTVRDLRFGSGTSDRWYVRVSADTESGSNAGSNWQLIRRDDSGANLGTVVTVNRATGAVAWDNDWSRPQSLGAWRIWANGTVGLRRKGSDPTSATDGDPLGYAKLTGTTSGTVGTGVTVAHGLGYAPTHVLITPRAAGSVYYTAVDATNVTVAGTAASIPFDLYVG